MKWKRIINRVADSLLLQMLLQLVTFRHAKGVLVVDRDVSRVYDWRSDIGHPRKRGIVILGVPSSRSAPRFEMRELGEKNHRLKGVEAAVVADFVMVVGLESAMHSQATKAVCEIFTLRDDHSAIAISTEILRREETECSERRRFSRTDDRLADFPRSANRLRSILDNREIRNRRANRIDRSELTKEIDRDHRLGARIHCCSRRLGRDVERIGIDISENRPSADVVDRARCRKESERRSDDFVAVTYIERSQRKQNCICAIGAADREPAVGKLGNGRLEALDGRTKNERLVVDDIHHRADNVVADGGMLGSQV